ncbi:MAG: hypothetical protein U1E29_10965 [Coriobacteriia bacterium]|nr:hypothetical protein [Coriobacteriia bacterium]
MEAKLARVRLVSVLLIGLFLLATTAWLVYGAVVISPGLRSDDPRAFMTAHLNAQRWGIPVDGSGIGGAFLASAVEVSGPAAISLQGSFDEELQFVVSYDSLWRAVTGAPPGHRQYFVYVGRDKGHSWRVLSSGTGP